MEVDLLLCSSTSCRTLFQCLLSVPLIWCFIPLCFPPSEFYCYHFYPPCILLPGTCYEQSLSKSTHCCSHGLHYYSLFHIEVFKLTTLSFGGVSQRWEHGSRAAGEVPEAACSEKTARTGLKEALRKMLSPASPDTSDEWSSPFPEVKKADQRGPSSRSACLLLLDKHALCQTT